MISSNMQLFRKALWEATCNVYERELALCEQDIKCSRRHYAKMRKILGVAVLPATTRTSKIKRRVIAALIAAALLLTGCAAYAYREEIKSFIETVFNDHIEVKYNDSEAPASSAIITEYYTLGYVPERYELVNNTKQPIRLICEWKSPTGEYLIFKQCTVESGLFVMDDETEDAKILMVGEYTVYYRFAGNNYYVWNNGIYAYELILSTQLPEQEVKAIIEGVVVER